VLLVWVYYAAQIFLLGAEFTKVHADHHGSRTAAKAVVATTETAVAGQHVEAPTTAGGTPVVAKDRLAIQASTAAAKTVLVKELVTLMAVSVAAQVMARQRRKLELGMKASSRALKRR
jgi:membrane protein